MQSVDAKKLNAFSLKLLCMFIGLRFFTVNINNLSIIRI